MIKRQINLRKIEKSANFTTHPHLSHPFFPKTELSIIVYRVGFKSYLQLFLKLFLV